MRTNDICRNSLLFVSTEIKRRPMLSTSKFTRLNFMFETYLSNERIGALSR